MELWICRLLRWATDNLGRIAMIAIGLTEFGRTCFNGDMIIICFVQKITFEAGVLEILQMPKSPQMFMKLHSAHLAITDNEGQGV